MMKFEEVYGFEFGKRGNVTAYPDRTTSDFEIEFTTPNHDESDVRFLFSVMAFIFDKNMLLQCMDADRNILYESNRQLSFFINSTGIDPKAGLPTAHPGIDPPAARETWLKNNTTYILRVYRARHSDNQPMALVYQSLDVDLPNEIPVDKSLDIAINGVDGIWVPKEQQ